MQLLMMASASRSNIETAAVVAGGGESVSVSLSSDFVMTIVTRCHWD